MQKKTEHADYLAQFRVADLFLDTFNYNAGATAGNALWAGLPVLTKSGKGYASRMAGSLLLSLGLPEMITNSEIEYEETALKLATDPTALHRITTKLSYLRESSPLFNTVLFTRHLEKAYRQSYDHLLDGKTPETLYVPPYHLVYK